MLKFFKLNTGDAKWSIVDAALELKIVSEESIFPEEIKGNEDKYIGVYVNIWNDFRAIDSMNQEMPIGSSETTVTFRSADLLGYGKFHYENAPVYMAFDFKDE